MKIITNPEREKKNNNKQRNPSNQFQKKEQT